MHSDAVQRDQGDHISPTAVEHADIGLRFVIPPETIVPVQDSSENATGKGVQDGGSV